MLGFHFILRKEGIVHLIPKTSQVSPNMAGVPELVSSIDPPPAGYMSYSSPIQTDQKPSEQSAEKILVESDPSPKYFVAADQNSSSEQPQYPAQEQSNSRFTSPTLHNAQSYLHTNHQGQPDGEWTFGFWDMLATKALCESSSQPPS